MEKINILHLCLQAPYNDYWGYQDNLIPKYHREEGHTVTVITTNTKHGNHGKIVKTEEADYRLDDGQRIIRLDYVHYKPDILARVFKYYKIYRLLCEIRPDFVMIHGLGCISVLQVIKYVKKINPKCTVIADNHLDYYNSAFDASWREKLMKHFFHLLNRYTQKYYKKVYGTTPWRVTYCEKVFGIKPGRTALLVTGGDDEKIHFDRKNEIRENIRRENNISNDDFVIVTGGKIDKTKNIHLLMQAVSEIDCEKLKLIVFGQPSADMEDEINRLAKNDKIRFIGWIDSDKAYDYFLASDLAIFPGTHSVLWEQACACGIPGIFNDWEGMHHVDVGGNSIFVNGNNIDEIKKAIQTLMSDKEKYAHMKNVAETKAVKEFSYREIAKRAIETK